MSISGMRMRLCGSGLTAGWPLVRIEMMLHRVARVLLVVALVSVGGSAPLAHAHPHGHAHSAARPEEARAHSRSAHPHRHPHRHPHHPGQGAHWHLTGRQPADTPGTHTLAGDRHHHAAVALATVAVERPSVRAGATPSMVEVRKAGTLPDPPGRLMPVAVNARPDPPPRIVLSARGPPV